MNNNFSDTPQSYRVPGMAPLDAKLLIETTAELTNTNNVYNFFYGYTPYLVEENDFFVWTDQLNGIEDAHKLLNVDFQYPSNVEYDGFDYSNKKFNFVRLKRLIGSDSMIIDQLLYHIDLCSQIEEDELGTLDTLRDYLILFLKRNNLLQYVDNLFAVGMSNSERKDFDDAYRTNSLYYVFGNSIEFNDNTTPTKITFSTKSKTGTSHNANGFLSSIASSIYYTIKNKGSGRITLQSHDGDYMIFEYNSDSEFSATTPYGRVDPNGDYQLVITVQIDVRKVHEFGTILKKAVKVKVEHMGTSGYAYTKSGQEIKETIYNFTRKEIVDNFGIMQHDLNIGKYIEEHFSYPKSLYSATIPVTFTPMELKYNRIISDYGPNDKDSIYLGNIEDYSGEDENDIISYIVRYTEELDFPIIMPDRLTKFVELDNESSPTLQQFNISVDELTVAVQNMWQDSETTLDKIKIVSIDTPVIGTEVFKLNGVEINVNDEILLSNIPTHFFISVLESGGNRFVNKFTYYLIDSAGNRSNEVEFSVVKQMSDVKYDRPLIMNVMKLIDSTGFVLIDWDETKRVYVTGPYHAPVIVIDPSVPNNTDIELTLRITRLSDGFEVLNETKTNVSSEVIETFMFDFPQGVFNQVEEFLFKFTARRQNGQETEIEKYITIIY